MRLHSAMKADAWHSRELFKMLDVDDSGYVGVRDLEQFLKENQSKKVKPQELQLVVSAWSVTGHKRGFTQSDFELAIKRRSKKQ